MLHRLTGGIAALALTFGAVAQNIVYSIDGGTPVSVASGVDFSVNVGNVPGITTLRVYDPSFTTLPDDDAGKITITGAVDGGELRIIVAGPTQTWIDEPQDPMANAGLRHLGIDAADGIVVSDAGLRAKTRLIAFVSGDVRGDVTLGQIRRIQTGAPGTTPSGIISANLTSVGDDITGGEIGPDEGAVGYIIAGDAISGTVTAELGKIDRVQVGPSEDADGISGDIIAESGSIQAIYSTGPIGNGSTTAPMRINAANGIGQIRTVDEAAPGVILERDVDAEIVANQGMLDDPLNWPYLAPPADGVLSSLEVGGTLNGSIQAGNIYCGGACEPAGIRVYGTCNATIDVDLMVGKTSIIARAFTAPITIGGALHGSLVATGGDGVAGRIERITVGWGDSPGIEAGFYTAYGRGLVSSALNRPLPTTEEEWFQSAYPLDSVIHAETSIGGAAVRTMAGTTCERYPPSIEAPILEELRIDAFAYGVVWSGQFDPSDRTVGYSQIGTFVVGCMRQTATVWMRDWDTAIVETDLFGDIHVPDVAAGSTLYIGRIFGVEGASPVEQACACTVFVPDTLCQGCDWDANYIQDSLVSHTPRNPWWPNCGDGPSQEDRRGQIWVHENQGLQGQIIINADNTGLSEAALWTGAVQVGEDSGGCPLMEVSPTPSSSEWTSPYYTGLSASLGGGAIGLVPFKMHRTDCRPAADSDLATNRTFLNSEFCGELAPSNAQPHLIHVFYGPVTTNHASNSPLEVRLDGGETVAREQWMKIELRRNSAGPLSREVDLTGDGLTRLLPGTYRSKGVTTAGTGQSLLLCDGLLTTATVPVAVFEEGDEYVFVLDPDCDADGANDNVEIANDQSLDLWPMDGLLDFCYFGNCDADVNCDSNLDSFDVAVMELAVQADYTDYCVAGNDADFNRDGNVDGFDVQALENAIGGTCPWD